MYVLCQQKKVKKKNDPHQHDNHNKANPNKKGPNGPQYPYYYHTISSKSKKDAFERSLRDGHWNKSIFDGDHFHNK